MTIDLCTVKSALACNPSPDNEMFRSLVLRALIAISNTVGGGSGAVLPQKSFAFGVVPSTYTTTALLDSTKKLTRIYVDNQTDADIEVSTDAGVTTSFTVFANSSMHRELGPYVGAAANSIMYRYKTAPTIGNVYFDGSY